MMMTWVVVVGMKVIRRYSLKVDSTGFNDEPVCSVREREVSQLITMLSY
jgi:hypothetical protein